MKPEKDKRAYISNENISPPLFGNKFLDSLTRTHIAIPVSLFFLYAAGLIYWTKTATDLLNWQIALLFLAGWAVFTFVEYHIHRGLFHMEHGESTEKQKEVSYKLHGVHHAYPKDKQRLAMPPVMSIAIGTILLLIFELIIDKYSFSFLAGFLVGYACYLIVHYSVHIFRAPNNFLKPLWTNHNYHHYKDDHAMFGVSSPFWDYVYGTYPKDWDSKKGKTIEVSAD